MTIDSAFGLTQIAQIALHVKDLERATEFYRSVLGMKFLFAAPGLAFFDCGGIRLMLSPAEKPELDHPASILYYKVTDLQAAHRTLLDRGVRFEGEPHVVHRAADYDLWMAFLRDSEDNLLALTCETPH
jgi:catechol 2,3-dioxygenase-like lactoylglutathione lyase family enzyme